MNNAFVGDVGDYGKYRLLRFLAGKGLKIGVNWYLTEDIDHKKHDEYLKNEENEKYDPVVFDVMKKQPSNVLEIKDVNIIPNALFYDGQIKADERDKWFEDSRSALENAEIIFADPDNGIAKKSTVRHITIKEIKKYFCTDKKDVVYYCHRARRTKEEWDSIKRQMKACGAEVFVLTYHRGMQRSYIFAIHKERAANYREYLDEFVERDRRIKVSMDRGGKEYRKKDPPFTEESLN